MSRFTMTLVLAGTFCVGAGGAAAQTEPAGQFGQRTSGGTYVPSTNDPGCAGVLCNPLPSRSASGGPAGSPSEVAPPPPCQGLLCSMTPYSMGRPYTAAEAAEVERQRAAAQAQMAAAPPPEATPVRHVRKRHKVARVVKTKAAKTAPAKSAPAKAAVAKTVPAAAAARTPAPTDDVQSLR